MFQFKGEYDLFKISFCLIPRLRYSLKHDCEFDSLVKIRTQTFNCIFVDDQNSISIDIDYGCIYPFENSFR